MKSGATCIAYETVTGRNGSLPLLKPMSEVAGRMSVQVGAHYLEKEQGGRGVLLGGVPGVAPAKVAILGGGVSGVNAAQMAIGMRADVTIYDINNDRLAELDMFFSSQIKTAYASRAAIANAVKEAELVIGAVLVPGAAAPKLVTREMLKTMKRGSVLVDIAIDQGGCFETSAMRRPMTTRSSRSTASSIIASPTCPARSRGPAPSRSTTRPCPSRSRSRTSAPRRRCGRIRISPRASTSRAARSATRRSPKRSTCRTSPSPPSACSALGALSAVTPCSISGRQLCVRLARASRMRFQIATAASRSPERASARPIEERCGRMAGRELRCPLIRELRGGRQPARMVDERIAKADPELRVAGIASNGVLEDPDRVLRFRRPRERFGHHAARLSAGVKLPKKAWRASVSGTHSRASIACARERRARSGLPCSA